ncbi:MULTISPECIES: hypothetical protein [unclassified Dysgonomonas]|uniref:hypothetical protein n=1 Tax=unclassified Dysgonomonas TaxID=2630389 RepID=UPI002474C0F8|nr:MULTISPECIES: hypothetical protein [unclassified Dysgonomonas]
MESYNTYEIEVIEPVMEFGSEIRKAEDFHRRLNYKYDWIHVERSSNGKITDVGNLKELRTNWNLLKERVERDYEGVAVDKYLNGISDRFVRDEHFKSIFSQYNEYGLLFPVVPKKHRNDWNMQRIITLDDNEKSELVETITFVNEDEEFRIYDLKLDRNETSSINIIESAGEIVLSKKDNLIESVDVSVKYFYDEIINNEWVFMLKRV